MPGSPMRRFGNVSRLARCKLLPTSAWWGWWWWGDTIVITIVSLILWTWRVGMESLQSKPWNLVGLVRRHVIGLGIFRRGYGTQAGYHFSCITMDVIVSAAHISRDADASFPLTSYIVGVIRRGLHPVVRSCPLLMKMLRYICYDIITSTSGKRALNPVPESL